MKLRELRLMLALLPAILWGCGGKADDSHEGHSHEGEHAHSHEGEDHDHDHEGEDHDHEGDDHDHDHEGESHEHDGVRHELGAAKVGTWDATARQNDDVAAGGETVFYVTLAGAADAAAPSAIRLWVGDEGATRSVKVQGEKVEDSALYVHAHVEIPEPLEPGDMLWVEVETAGAEPAKASFALATGAAPSEAPATNTAAPAAPAEAP